MNAELIIIGFLLGFILVRELFFMWNTQKLTNKIMSRSYYDYRVAEVVPDNEAGKGFYGDLKVKEDVDSEDIGRISDII